MAAKKRVPFSKSLDTICEVVEERLGSMPAAEADAKRAEIHRIASRARGNPFLRDSTLVILPAHASRDVGTTCGACLR